MLVLKSSSTVHGYLERLEEKGLIKLVGPRAIEILHIEKEEPTDEAHAVIQEIAALLSKYDFPLEVLKDVHKRLVDCTEPQYVRQQARYLHSIVDAGLVSEK